jgi:hypothetical protein
MLEVYDRLESLFASEGRRNRAYLKPIESSQRCQLARLAM